MTKVESLKEVDTIEGSYSDRSVCSLKLKDQAKFLGIELIDITISRSKEDERNWYIYKDNKFASVEEAGLFYFNNLGWDGISDNVFPFSHIYKFIIEQLQIEYEAPICYAPMFNEPPIPFKNTLPPFSELDYYVNNNLNLKLLKLVINKLYDELTEIEALQFPSLKIAYNFDNYERLWNGVGGYFIRKIVLHKIKYASGMWADTELLGWPDLTLWKNGNIKLVEVKYTDKLHFNQVNWFRNIAKPLGYDFSLLRVVDSKRK